MRRLCECRQADCAHQDIVSFRLNPPTVARESLLDSLVQDVEDGVFVFNVRDGLPITRAQARERARNIVAGLIGNYQIELHPEGRS